jgi:Na+-translocating ferredoxin:NAD+ oxidoreductase RnfG subunit
LNSVAKDLQTPVKQFIHTNIKQAQQKKQEINVASMIREEHTKNFQKKQETEAKKEETKRDEPGVRFVSFFPLSSSSTPCSHSSSLYLGILG